MSDYFGQQEIRSDADGVTTIRGFLYQTESGEWILSQEPQLKTCCAGSKSKVKEQIYLVGDVQGFSTGSVVEVTGKYRNTPQYSKEGVLMRYHTIENPHINRKETDLSTLLWIVGGVLLLGALITLFFRYGKGVFPKT